jgi:ATP-dependent RNA helicase DeaD
MSKEAFKVHIDPKNQVNQDIKHLYCFCTAKEKNDKVEDFLKEYPEEQGLIFCKTKLGAVALNSELEKRGYSAGVLHGDMNQLEREKVMRAFKKERLRLLVATDVAARGIDIPALSFVLHYQLPDQVEYYTHRSGRTARAGKKGVSFAFIHPQDKKMIKELERSLNIQFFEGYTKPSSPWANSPWQ